MYVWMCVCLCDSHWIAQWHICKSVRQAKNRIPMHIKQLQKHRTEPEEEQEEEQQQEEEEEQRQFLNWQMDTVQQNTKISQWS